MLTFQPPRAEITFLLFLRCSVSDRNNALQGHCIPLACVGGCLHAAPGPLDSSHKATTKSPTVEKASLTKRMTQVKRLTRGYAGPNSFFEFIEVYLRTGKLLLNPLNPPVLPLFGPFSRLALGCDHFEVLVLDKLLVDDFLYLFLGLLRRLLFISGSTRYFSDRTYFCVGKCSDFSGDGSSRLNASLISVAVFLSLSAFLLW